MNPILNSDFIKQSALSVGFDACGTARADALTEDAKYMKAWLQADFHAEMSYLERNFEKRTDPRVLVPNCKTIVVVALNYYPSQTQPVEAPRFAKYAYSDVDYHQVIKSKLLELEQQICSEFGDEVVNKDFQHSFVDSAPVLERRWAERVGLGWIGRNKQLICPDFGSYVFLGILMLNAELPEYDLPIRNRCGACTKCIDSCPTQALTADGLDARRCISYLTIEKKGDISEEFQDKLSGYVFGCDICADVCPWNKKWAKPHSHVELKENNFILAASKEAWGNLTKSDFNLTFRHSAVKRAGYEKLIKNISSKK